MKNNILYFAFLLLITLQSTIISEEQSNKNFPKILTAKGFGEIVKHTDYILSYSEEHEQAEWVAYTVSINEINTDIERTNDFRKDPHVSTGSATLADYKGSGYDRGHLAPAGDMKENELEMSESFFMSNMSPQLPTFNRGGWKKLENLVRTWVKKYDSVAVITGPILRKGLPTIGENEVSIPEFYYKSIFIYTENKIISFLMPHQKIEQELQCYIVSADSIENLTGLNLFQELK